MMDFGSDELDGDVYHQANRFTTNTRSPGHSYAKSRRPWNFAKYLFGFGNRSSTFRKKFDEDLPATRSVPAIYLSSRQKAFSDGGTSQTGESVRTTLNTGRNGGCVNRNPIKP